MSRAEPDHSRRRAEHGDDSRVITNAGAMAGPNIMLNAEGSQMFKINGKYFLFNITWPRGCMGTVIVQERLTPYLRMISSRRMAGRVGFKARVLESVRR